jgi:sialic acid synthase SpsE
MLPDERKLGRREGLYTTRKMMRGETITAADVEIKRPAIGLRARYAPIIIGAIAEENIEKGAPLSWKNISFR